MNTKVYVTFLPITLLKNLDSIYSEDHKNEEVNFIQGTLISHYN